jgi:hypothetical protein
MTLSATVAAFTIIGATAFAVSSAAAQPSPERPAARTPPAAALQTPAAKEALRALRSQLQAVKPGDIPTAPEPAPQPGAPDKK